MTSKLNQRHIVIENFEDGEIVHYPLIILKVLINEDVLEEGGDCKRKVQEKMRATLKHFDYEVSNTSHDQLKFILYLREGNNDIVIKYCCEDIKLNLRYIPRESDYTVCPLYIVCRGHDGKFQAPETQDSTKENGCRKIELITRLLQCVTAEKIYEKAYSRKTFSLENACQIFYSELSCSEIKTMNQKEIWEHLAREIMKSEIGSTKKKYLGFLSCTRYHGEKYEDWMKSHEDLINITEGYVALGGGGLALFGTASLYTWPMKFEDIVGKFEDQTLVDKKKFLDDSCYRGTLGGCFSTSVGSVLHELCHTFDLGHTASGIMSRGFDNIDKVFVPHMYSGNSISSKFRRTIQFEENFEPTLLSEKLENKPKNFKIKTPAQTERDADDTFFTKSCAAILNHHRWFNSYPEVSKYVLKFNKNSNSFISTAGLRVVEIRRRTDELVLRSWVFDGKILKYSFYIPINIQDKQDFEKKTSSVIFAEDNVGNSLKVDYSSSREIEIA